MKLPQSLPTKGVIIGVIIGILLIWSIATASVFFERWEDYEDWKTIESKEGKWYNDQRSHWDEDENDEDAEDISDDFIIQPFQTQSGAVENTLSWSIR